MFVYRSCISSRGKGAWHHFSTEAGVATQLGFSSSTVNTISGNDWATEKAMKASPITNTHPQSHTIIRNIIRNHTITRTHVLKKL